MAANSTLADVSDMGSLSGDVARVGENASPPEIWEDDAGISLAVIGWQGSLAFGQAALAL